jgi:hypothetical protein
MKLTMTARFDVANGSPEPSTGEEQESFDLESFLDQVLEELLRLEGVEDSTMSASLAEGTVTIMVTVDAPLPELATYVGMSAIRAAFHAAGASTPDWPTFHDLSIGTELVGADQ